MPKQTRRDGFTLIELLVVIGIIAILMAILVPVISHVRQTGYVAATRARLLAIQNGVEAYKQRFESYPGPLADAQLQPLSTTPFPSTSGTLAPAPTTSENLVFGLLGGLQLTNTGVVYNPALVGRGPQSLNPLKIQSYETLVDPVSAGLDPAKDKLDWRKWSSSVHQPFPNQSSFADTDAPEFVDNFPDALPILYVRARVGVSGVIGDSKNNKTYPTGLAPAYNMAALYPYTFPALPFPPSANPPWPDPTKLSPPSDLYAPGYFGTPADPKVPRQKDAYLLIAAGQDRKYGTSDDIVSGGDLRQQ